MRLSSPKTISRREFLSRDMLLTKLTNGYLTERNSRNARNELRLSRRWLGRPIADALRHFDLDLSRLGLLRLRQIQRQHAVL